MGEQVNMLSRWKKVLTGSFVSPQGRLPGLDALRGIAALIVVLYHYTLGYPMLFGPHSDRLLATFPVPAIGVQIFFAISGFVIFMTLERCHSGRDFFVSRFARLYPPFIFCMMLTAFVSMGTGFNPRNTQFTDVLMHLPMVVGLLGRFYIDPSYWTLTCEICFYALIAVFFYQVQHRVVPEGASNFARWSRNPLLPGMLAWMLVAVYGRGQLQEDLYPRWALALNFAYGHLFVSGIAIYGYTKGKVLVPTILLAMAVLFGGVTAEGHYSVMQSIKVLGIAALLWAGAHLHVTGRAATLAGFLGGISYSLYLLHQTLGYMVIHTLESLSVNANIAVLGTLCLMIGLAYLVRKYVEIPSQNLLLKWYAPWKSAKKINYPAADPVNAQR